MLASAVIWISSLASAYLCCSGKSTRRTTFVLGVLTVWVVILIAPIHVLAGLQLLGVLRRVTVDHAVWLNLLIMMGSVLIYKRHHAANPPAICPWSGQRISGIIPPYLGLSAAILACSYLLFAVNLWTSYAQGSDALSYHLPLAVTWLQTGSFRIVPRQGWEFSLPANCEVAMMLALASKRQSLAPAVNLLALACLAISTYALGKRSAGQIGAYAATVMVLTIPMIEFQAFSGYVDLFGLAFLAAAFELFLCRYEANRPPVPESGRERFSVAILWFSALACGLSLGTKTTFLPYCAFYFGVVVYSLWQDRRKHKRSFVALTAVVTIGMLLPSAFWFTRSLVATGNPIYPVALTLRGRTLLKGFEQVHGSPRDLLVYNPPGGLGDHGDGKYVTSRSEWWIYPWTEWLRDPGEVFPVPYGEASGLGGVFATFGMTGIAFAFYEVIRGRPPRGLTKLPRQVLLLGLTWFLMWWFAMHRVLRFGLPVWVLGLLLAARLIFSLNINFPRALGSLFVASVLATCVVSSLVPLHELGGRVLQNKWSRAWAYDYPRFIDQLPADSIVLNDSVFLEKTFALAGSSLTNRVIPAFEAPKELTQDFVRCRGVDYVVQIEALDQPEPPVVSTTLYPIGKEIFHAVQGGKVWSVLQVARTNAGADWSACMK